jgi:hypothetical protein
MFKVTGKVMGPTLDLSSPMLLGLQGLESLPPLEPCSEQDVRVVLDQFGVEDLRRLDRAFERGLVVRRSFSAPGGRGCLLYHLDNAIVSFGAQSKRLGHDAPAYRASQKLIAAWDSERLTEADMRRMLAGAILAREEPAAPHGRKAAWKWRWVGKLSDTVTGLCAKAAAESKGRRAAKVGPARTKSNRSTGVNRKPAVV